MAKGSTSPEGAWRNLTSARRACAASRPPGGWPPSSPVLLQSDQSALGDWGAGAGFAKGGGVRRTPGPSADELPQRCHCHCRRRAARPRPRPTVKRARGGGGGRLRRGPRTEENGLSGAGSCRIAPAPRQGAAPSGPSGRARPGPAGTGLPGEVGQVEEPRPPGLGRGEAAAAAPLPSARGGGEEERAGRGTVPASRCLGARLIGLARLGARRVGLARRGLVEVRSGAQRSGRRGGTRRSLAGW